MTTETETPTNRPLHVIAEEIQKDWEEPYFGAVPYLEAMASLVDVTDPYGEDDAFQIILYFLSNAGTWRGETARRVKDELREMVK